MVFIDAITILLPRKKNRLQVRVWCEWKRKEKNSSAAWLCWARWIRKNDLHHKRIHGFFCSFSFEQDIIFDTQFLFHIFFGVFLSTFSRTIGHTEKAIKSISLEQKPILCSWLQWIIAELRDSSEEKMLFLSVSIEKRNEKVESHGTRSAFDKL